MKRSSQAITLVLISSPLILTGCRQNTYSQDGNYPPGSRTGGGYYGGVRTGGAALRGTSGTRVSTPAASPRGGFGGFFSGLFGG
jgi:hypothetical protein